MVRPKKVRVPLLVIPDDAVLMVIVPALAIKLPVTVMVPATENVALEVAPLALITRLPYA